jgi:hypothetical protein
MKNPVPEWIPVSCENCAHSKDASSLLCAAYPEGIPVWIRSNANSHLTPQPDDNGIQYEPSPKFLQTLADEGILPQQEFAASALGSQQIEDGVGQPARSGRSDVRRALDLIKEASPELFAMVSAKAEPKAKINEHDRDAPSTLKIEQIKFRAIYSGIFKSGDDELPCLGYYIFGRGLDGQERLINRGVYVTDPADLARLQSEFEVGEEIDLVLESNRCLPDISIKLISFEKVTDADKESSA